MIWFHLMLWFKQTAVIVTSNNLLRFCLLLSDIMLSWFRYLRFKWRKWILQPRFRSMILSNWNYGLHYSSLVSSWIWNNIFSLNEYFFCYIFYWLFLTLCIWVCYLEICNYTHVMQWLQSSEESVGFPWKWSYGQLLAIMRVLGNKPSSSARAINALNYWAIQPTSA